VIIGGGPAGSSAAISLANNGLNVAVIEKNIFPRDVLCGEFLSHEVTSALRSFGLIDEFLLLKPNRVSHFRFIPENGRAARHPLGFEGFALKRSLLDQLLLKKAKSLGTTVVQPAEVVSMRRVNTFFEILCKTNKGIETFAAVNVIGAYGRQNIIDKSLNRSFVSSRSGYSGIKYHVPKEMLNGFKEDEIQIFSSNGIYCGVNCVNENEVTLCSLSDKNINQLEPKNALNELLEKNPAFKNLFVHDPLPILLTLPVYGTGNIFFGKRSVVENGMYMIGDAAGVIAPLAGDGIGMAMESGMLVAKILIEAKKNNGSSAVTESLYEKEWKIFFSKRIRVALRLQQFMLNSRRGNIGGQLMHYFPLFAEKLIQWTRQ
jgi:flavin-dependent dehydrogenase